MSQITQVAAGLISYWGLWWRGIFGTLELTILAIVLGTVLAVVITAALYSQSSVLRIAARIYVELFRAIPALVLLGTLYFVLPLAFGLRLSSFNTAALGLSLNLAPFVVECIRGAIDSVPTIQYESATVLGVRGWKRTYYIVWPQAMKRMIPPVAGQYITTLKLTSLAASIGVQEIWNVTSQVTTMTSMPIETRIGGALLYVAMILPLLWVSARLERRFGVRGLGIATER